MKTIQQKVEKKVEKFQELETKLIVAKNALEKNEQFKQFIQLQKEFDTQAKVVWDTIKEMMIEAGEKTVDTSWVKLTIVDAKNLEIDEKKLSNKFKVLVPNKKEINAYIKEHHILPKGVKQTDAPQLRKTFRDFVS